MTDKSKSFLEALLKALGASNPDVTVEGFKIGRDGNLEPIMPPSKSDAAKRAALMKVSDMVDLDLVNGLNQWVRSQSLAAEKPFTNGQLCSSMAYWLSLTIVESLLVDKRPEDEVCSLTEIYGDYIHNVSHAIYRGESKDVGK